MQTKKYGGIVGYRRMLFTNAVLITDPEALKRVMITNVRNYSKPTMGAIGAILDKIMGKNLAFVNEPEHSRQKHVIAPAFR